MIAAILGLDKSDYADSFKTSDARIALGLVRPVKKTRIGHNLIHGKKAKLFSRLPRTGARTQVRVEYVKDPEYRVYFAHRDAELFERLSSLVENHETVYTVSLGLSNLLANFGCEGVFSMTQERVQGPVPMDSVVPEDAARVVFEPGKAYFSAQMPMEMDKKKGGQALRVRGVRKRRQARSGRNRKLLQDCKWTQHSLPLN